MNRSTIFIPAESKIPASQYLTMLIAALDAVNEGNNEDK